MKSKEKKTYMYIRIEIKRTKAQNLFSLGIKKNIV